MSSVSHPHVMPILDWGVDDDGDYWYAMPVARGSLKELWEEGHVTGTAEEIAGEVLEAVSQGLGAMHAAGFVHRDVTPGNVLALDGDTSSSGSRWVIADCGLVRRPVGETTLTLTGSATTMGTLGFISPEAHGDPHRVTKAADVYSLGRNPGVAVDRPDAGTDRPAAA
jgi:serine/threonine protein kinase